MSTLTKICVVVLFVLVLVACVVFIKEATVPFNYKALYESEREANKQAKAANGHLTLALKLAERRRADEYKQSQLRIDALGNAIETRDASIRKLDQKVVGFGNTTALLTAEVGRLTRGVKDHAALNKTLTDALTVQQKTADELGRRLREAMTEVRERQRDNDNLNAQVKVMRENLATREAEVADLNELIKKLEAGGATAGKIAAPQPVERIDGEVTAVRAELVSFNVGDKDGVKKGMLFYVYHGANFVAHVRVEDVSTTSCAGIVVDAIRDIKRGQKATTSLE